MKTLSLTLVVAWAALFLGFVAVLVVGSRSQRRRENQLRRELRVEDRCRNCGEIPADCPCEYFLALLN
jgi:hypothetical protein